MEIRNKIAMTYDQRWHFEAAAWAGLGVLLAIVGLFIAVVFIGFGVWRYLV